MFSMYIKLIEVLGIQLMKNLGFENVNPRNHDVLDSLEKVAETFAYYF